MGSRSGVTTGQGLVILLILVVLVGMLVYSVHRNNRNYEAPHICTHNLKVLGMAIMAYADDYDGVYPPSLVSAGSDVDNGQAVSTIVNALDPYLKSPGYTTRGVWRCPGQRGRGLYVKSKTDQKGIAGTVWPLHYVCNRNLLRPIGGEFSHYRYLNAKGRKKLTQRDRDYVVDSRKRTGVRRTDVKAPASTIVLLEWRQTITRCPLCPEDESIVGNISQREWNSRMSSSARYLEVHRGGLNIGFADGHVRWYPASFPLDKNGITFYPDEDPAKTR